MKRDLCEKVFNVSMQLGIVFANERNDGEPLVKSMRSGRPIRGRYCGQYDSYLRKLVRRCKRSGKKDPKVSWSLAHLLYKLELAKDEMLTEDELWIEWQKGDGMFNAYEYQRRIPKWSDEKLQVCYELPFAEKVRRCNEALDFFDDYFATRAV